MVDNLGFGIGLTVCEFIFGIPIYNNSDFKIINFLILIEKWYMKTQNKLIYFIEFIAIIKEKTEILRYI